MQVLESVLEILALGLSLAAVAVAAGLLILSRRASRARTELAANQHAMGLALDRRCDTLQLQLDDLQRRQRIGHLLELVSVSERQGRLGAGVARRLERYVLELQDEARLEAG